MGTANAVRTGQVTITCAKADGTQQVFQVNWDNANQYFEGKGDIARLFCEGGHSGGGYTTFISTTVTDLSLRYYLGVLPQMDTPTATNETQTAVETVTVPVTDTQTPVLDSPTVVVETQTVETPTVVLVPNTSTSMETQTLTSESSTLTSQIETPTVPSEIPLPTPVPVVEPQPIVVPAPQPAPQPQPEPPVVPVVEEPVAEEPQPVEEPPAPPAEEVPPTPPATDEIQEQPEPTPEPSPEPILESEPDSQPDIAPEPPVVVEPEIVPEAPKEPQIVLMSPSLDLSTLAPETPVELENGVILTAEVVVALQLLENPAELLGELFTDPGQVLTAISNIGADMSPEVREQSEKVVVSAIIAGGIAVQSAASVAGAAAYRRKP